MTGAAKSGHGSDRILQIAVLDRNTVSENLESWSAKMPETATVEEISDEFWNHLGADGWKEIEVVIGEGLKVEIDWLAPYMLSRQCRTAYGWDDAEFSEPQWRVDRVMFGRDGDGELVEAGKDFRAFVLIAYAKEINAAIESGESVYI